MEIKTIDLEYEQALMQRYQLSALCARVLAARMASDEEIQELLEEPRLADPWQAQGMEAVIQRLKQAQKQGEKVLVCGDYDADGICATAILVDALKRFGITCGFYIPNRFREGYGLHEDTVRMAAEKGYSLIVTVDNGVRAFAALERAQELGLEVIVTDHHALDETRELPCRLLLHPQFMGEAFAYLSGAGVALEISRALGCDTPAHIVFAGIAAIGDVMVLKRETRAIVKRCVALLNERKVRSVQLLANDNAPWDEVKIAFQIVPKLNVTGRLADKANANNTVRYLLSENGNELVRVAKQIASLNEMRKAMSQEMSRIALNRLSLTQDFLIVADASFHEGIVGSVAGSLSERFQKPCMVLACKGDQYRGSIRAPQTVDLRTFFTDLDCLLEYGGHAQAAGICFAKEDLARVCTYAQRRIQEQGECAVTPPACIPLSKELLSLRQVESLQRLRPFGNGFEEPLFCVEASEIVDSRTMGGEKHIKWLNRDGVEFVYFNAGERMAQLKEGDFDTFIGTVGVNTFRYQKKVNVFVKDIMKKNA